MDATIKGLLAWLQDIRDKADATRKPRLLSGVVAVRAGNLFRSGATVSVKGAVPPRSLDIFPALRHLVAPYTPRNK
jgi:hypothetical protein